MSDHTDRTASVYALACDLGVTVKLRGDMKHMAAIYVNGASCEIIVNPDLPEAERRFWILLGCAAAIQAAPHVLLAWTVDGRLVPFGPRHPIDAETVGRRAERLACLMFEGTK